MTLAGKYFTLLNLIPYIFTLSEVKFLKNILYNLLVIFPLNAYSTTPPQSLPYSVVHFLLPHPRTYSHALPAWDSTQRSQSAKGPHGAECGNICRTGPNSRKVNQRQLHHGKKKLVKQKHDWLMQQHSELDAAIFGYCKEHVAFLTS
jgi:hypothetical protein